MPDFVCHYLVCRILEHITDLLRVSSLSLFFISGSAVVRIYGPAPKQNFSFPSAERRDGRLDIAQQRRLSACRSAAEYHKFTVIHREADILKSRLFSKYILLIICNAGSFGICKCQIADLKYFHFTSSLTSAISGIMQNARYAQ